MKCIKASYLSFFNEHSSLEEISLFMNDLRRNSIAEVPWPSFQYKPNVAFAIAHNDKCIFLKYFVKENSIKAEFVKTNQPVYKDSCVEFFISFNGDHKYYNFEFNCIGTCLLGFGSKEKRGLLPEDIISEIKHLSFVTTTNCVEEFAATWELTLMIPLKVFHNHTIQSLKGLSCKVNFFKCGDDLETPHFLTWNMVMSDAPDFHLPQYFGTLQFE